MCRREQQNRPLTPIAILPAVAIFTLFALWGCPSNYPHAGAYRAHNKADCLPDLQLTDQNGRAMSLAHLKGGAVLLDFIYTSCPGPCLTLTSRMQRVAARLGPLLGRRVSLVSITVDPEHDGPAQLREYIRNQGIDGERWLFLTGRPGDIDQVLARFKLRREPEPDGSVAHVSGVYLLGPDGREVREYDGEVLRADAVLRDIQEVLSMRSDGLGAQNNT